MFWNERYQEIADSMIKHLYYYLYTKIRLHPSKSSVINYFWVACDHVRKWEKKFLCQANIGSKHGTNHLIKFSFPKNLRNYRVILDTEFPDSVFPNSIFLDSELSDSFFWHANLNEENKLTRKVCWDQINGKEKIPLSRRETIFLQILFF